MAKKFKSMTGTEAAAWTAFAFTEVAGIYPITPSTPIAEQVEAWSAEGKTNIWGEPVSVVEMQSEAGAASMCHGALQTGSLASTYTASQGLLLMIPNLYKLAGQGFPAVLHVAARSLATSALSIFGDHQDIYATRQTGVSIIASRSVQATMDLGGVAHLAAIEAHTPFIHFNDGFRTSHEISKIEVFDYADYKKLVNQKQVDNFKANAINPMQAKTRGTAANDDIYFQLREAQNKKFDNIPDVVAKYMTEVSKITGRKYAPFVYEGAKDADRIIIAMGSVTEVVREVIEHENKNGGKVGLVEVMLYRPFSVKHLLKVLPTTVKKIAVLDRTKENGSFGEPLFLDVQAVIASSDIKAQVVGGRYGLSSKDTPPGDIKAVFDMLKSGPKHNFTIGINDDVTNLSLPHVSGLDTLPKGTTELLFYGLGSDGTVSANKNTIKIIGDKTDQFVQGYFQYDSKKAGGITRSHLRFGPKPITSEYYVKHAHFVACSNDSYVYRLDMADKLREGGTFLLNTTKSVEEVLEYLPNTFKKELADRKAKFYIIDSISLAKEIGLGSRTNTLLQSAFFKLNEQIIPYKEALKYMKEYAEKQFSKKGKEIVEMNFNAIDKGAEGLIEVPVDAEWSKLKEDNKMLKAYNTSTKFAKDIAYEISTTKGDKLPVSAFMDLSDGAIEAGTTAHEKRDVANFVPEWTASKCIQCNLCAVACPHAVVRAGILTDDEVSKSPVELDDVLDAKKSAGDKFRITISPKDCTGCALCVAVCPTKALEMVPTEQSLGSKEQEKADYIFNDVKYKKVKDPKTFADTQFAQPLFEFSGACAGCGETNYIKLLTQMYGEQLIIANATGCSSIYGGSYPSSPYRTANDSDAGVAWANSLFEDGAEFGFGMAYSSDHERSKILAAIQSKKLGAPAQKLADELVKVFDDPIKTKEISYDLIPALEKDGSATAKSILKLKGFIAKPIQFMIGGDGWAYDIGYGGLDHVIASNMDVNILVLDTEVYSNTGGQASKSSQLGSIAKLAAGGRQTTKKDLGAIAMSYGHVYVASIAMGANPQQVFNAFKEAVEHKGPSLIIAYAPCIEHGIKGGLTNTDAEQKLVAESGYWPLYRFNPNNDQPMTIDRQPNFDKYDQIFTQERRYAMLSKVNPEFAKTALERNKQAAKDRFAFYEKMKK